MWAIGPITSALVAAAGLAGGFLLIFAGTFCWDSGDCTQVAHLVLLLRGALFAAPLVGATMVLVDWLRRSRKWHAGIAAVAMLSPVIIVLAARFLGLRDVSPRAPLSWVEPAPSISAEGRYVAFASLAADLVPGDMNGYADVLVHDQQTGDTFLVSVASDGTQGNGDSRSPSISADARFVAFASSATQLVPGDTNMVEDIFVHDRQTGQTERVSVASEGREGNMDSKEPSISSDGRYVAFASSASNLVPDDSNDADDIFVHDRQTGETVRVSVASDGTQGDDWCFYPSISADGRYVAFRCNAGNLVPGDTNDAGDVFVHDRQTGQTERISVASDGTEGNGIASCPSISSDGRYVAFASWASNLVPRDTNYLWDIFVHDRQTGQTERVSVASDGVEGKYDSDEPSISADVRYVAFASGASNLVPGDTNDVLDIFVHERETGETVRISVASDGTEGKRGSNEPSISADGRYVAFTSWASNLVPGDTNDADDVFVHDRQTGQTVRVSVPSEGTQTD